MTKRLVLIDGMSVFYRGFFAMPGLSLPDGTPTGGVFGFASIAIEVIKKLEPDYVAVAWDKSKTATRKRKDIYPEYKAGRTRPPDNFFAQIPLLHELLESFGWPLLEMDDYEADDIIGTIAAAASKQGIETCIVSGDYDMMQLLDDHTRVYINRKGADMMRFTRDEFEAKYNVRLEQFVDYKALVGDSSDNIPGVRGVGPKAAEQLLAEYDTLDDIYSHIDELKPALQAKLRQSHDNAFMSRELVRIWCDAPIELDWHEADVNNTHLDRIADQLGAFEFHSLIKRLPKHMQQTADTGLYFERNDEVILRDSAWDEAAIFQTTAVALNVVDGELWLSADQATVMHVPVGEVSKRAWDHIAKNTVVAYDVKQLYHDLARADVFVEFDNVHDIRQAAFLLDPLRRDRSLGALVSRQIDAARDHLAAIWQVYAWQTEAFEATPAVAKIAHEFDFPLIYHLFEMEHHGIILDTALLKTMSAQLGKQYEKLEQEMYSLVGYEFNIASPAQLSEVLFTKLLLPTTGIKKGKTGYSTGQKELNKLRGQHPIIELIEQTRELAKLKNTYVDALPKMVDEQSRLHTTFNQDVAATGRLSSIHPNLQNIPIRTEMGRKIRDAFVPASGNVFVSADYSQFELRLAAVMSGDQQMIDDFNSGVDIHTKTAADVRGIALEDVTKAMRRDAKVINFGVLYGMGPHALAETTGMSFFEAKTFIDDYFELRKPIREFIDKTLKQAEDEGYVETLYGRRRPTPDVKSSNYMVREAAKRAAANMPIQGTEADLMKRAMINLDEKLPDGAVQILQIHDSILVECPEAVAESVGDIMRSTMESIAPELRVALNVDVSIGKNWGEV